MKKHIYASLIVICLILMQTGCYSEKKQPEDNANQKIEEDEQVNINTMEHDQIITNFSDSVLEYDTLYSYKIGVDLKGNIAVTYLLSGIVLPD